MMLNEKFDFKNPDYIAVYKYRSELIRKIRLSSINLIAAKKHYKDHPVDFIEDLCVTVDPRKTEMPLMPFILFEKQKEFINWLYKQYSDQKDGIVEKSRDMGASWISCAFSLWLWLFNENLSIGFGSNKAENVDTLGNPKSLLEKIRILLRHLPIEFLPIGYEEDKHAVRMKIINPQNNSTIIGEVGKNIGRSGRTTLYFKDESAFYEQPFLIESAISMNSDVKIDISTPNGVGGVFYKKRFSGEYDVFILDWRDDPRKDIHWYNKKKRQLDAISPVIAASELDRNYFASIEDTCIPYMYINAAIDLKLECTGQIIGGLDVADEGRDSNALIIRKGANVFFIKKWDQGDTTQTARKAYDHCLTEKIDTLNFDCIGVGAGVKGEFRSLRDKNGEKFKTKTYPISTASSPSKGYFPENMDSRECRKNVDMFLNLRAELWWKLRRRFEKTYEHTNKIKIYPHDELISIPNNDELIRELNSPLYEITETGKIQIESKKKMAKRGISSPNLADALCLAFCIKYISNIKFRVL